MKLKKSVESSEKLVKQFLEKLFDLIGVKTEMDISEDKEKDSIMVKIDVPEAGLLIGSRGNTLNSIQMLAALNLYKLTGEWKRVVIDISGWREKEEEKLINLAMQTAERVKATREAQNLYNLSSFQRRIIHLALSSDKEIETESQGEGSERYLVVRTKKLNN